MTHATERYLFRAATSPEDHDVLIRFIVDSFKNFHRLRLQEYYSNGWHIVQTNRRPNRKEIDDELNAKIKTFRAIGYEEYPKAKFFKRGKVLLKNECDL